MVLQLLEHLEGINPKGCAKQAAYVNARYEVARPKKPRTQAWPKGG